MKLFGKKTCDCKNDCTAQTMQKAQQDIQSEGIKILGSNCNKCISLEKNTKDAMNELGWDCRIEHISDFTQIASYGVMTTPALVINGKVVSYGKVLTIEEIKFILETNVIK